MESILYSKNKWQIGLDKNNRFVVINTDTGVADYFIIYDIDSIADYKINVGYDNPFILPKYIKEFIDSKIKELLEYKSKGIKGRPYKL